jgi:hypothetical protein
MEQSPSWQANSHQLVTKFTAFYGARKFITVFAISHYWTLSSATTCYFEIRFNIILPSTPRSPNLSLPLNLPTKIWDIFLICHMWEVLPCLFICTQMYVPPIILLRFKSTVLFAVGYRRFGEPCCFCVAVLRFFRRRLSYLRQFAPSFGMSWMQTKWTGSQSCLTNHLIAQLHLSRDQRSLEETRYLRPFISCIAESRLACPINVFFQLVPARRVFPLVTESSLYK